MTERMLKLLTLALDSAAHKGEMETAAIMFVRELKKENIAATDLRIGKINPFQGYNWKQSTGYTPPPPKPKAKPRPKAPPPKPWTFPFGKHKDQPLKDVDLSYLVWALANITQFDQATKDILQAEITRRATAA
jgi:hypothetical protein